MTEKRDKVNVDDIIGLIKTDEHTDSVTLKKEAQLSICEKRLIELEKENEQLKQELENNIASYKKCNRRVFDLIDKKIKEVDTIGAEVLKDLRRELME